MLKQALRFLGIGFFLSGAFIYALAYMGYLEFNTVTHHTPVASTTSVAATSSTQSAQTTNQQNAEETTLTQEQSVSVQQETTAEQATNASEQTTAASVANAGESVKLTVAAGDYSFTVAQKLVDAGVITDANAFNSYLAEQNLATIIQNGTFAVKKGQSFEELGKILTTYPGN